MTKIFCKRIENEEVNLLPEKAYEGKIILVETDEQVDDAVAVLEKYTVLGFDTETKPNFRKGERNKIALLQLACEEAVFIFMMKKITNKASIQRLLTSKKVLKVGVAIHDDIRGLNKYLSKVNNTTFVELQSFVKEYGIEEASLKKLTAIVLNFRISKAQRVSNWEAEPLKPSQITYAATDAWVSLRIYEELVRNESL